LYFRNFFRRHLLVGIFVIAPTALAAFHFAFLASDVFVSESRFIVRAQEQSPSLGGVGALFKSFTTAGSEDVMFVRDYMLSHEIAQRLDGKLGLRKAFGAADTFSRFPSPWGRDSLESFYEYYDSKVKVEVDPQSSVGVLTVSGFTPAAVSALNRALLDAATARINTLNSQMRNDTLEVAEHELQTAELRQKAAQAALATFRVDNGVVDPERQAALDLQFGQEIQLKLAAAKVQLAQVTSVAPLSPQIAMLRNEIQSLTAAANQVQENVTGPEKNSRAMTARAYESLGTERDIAIKMVAAANEALIRARVEVESKHLYLEMVSAPTLPDDALYPKRVRSVLAVFMVGLLLWGIASMLLTGVREHQSAA
jgi:capsular polysaccharide transport system permease protein